MNRIPFIIAASLVPFALQAVQAQCVPAVQRLITDRKYDDARTQLETQLKRAPNDDAAMHCMGRLRLEQGESSDAIDWFEKAVKINAKSGQHQLGLGDALVAEAPKANFMKQALIARQMKEAYEQALVLDPTLVDARRGLIGFYSQAPAAMGGSMTKAREQAAEIVKVNPMRGHMSLASIAERDNNDYATAEKEFLAAIAARPDSAQGYSATGGFYRRRERWAESMAMYEKSLKAKPEPTLASAIHNYMGVIHQHDGRVDQARAEFQAAIAANPKNEDAKKALALLK